MKTRSVLIVDDSPDMLELIQRQLNPLGLITFSALNVTDAVDLLKTTSVDFLITDLKMPGIGGMELVQYAKVHFPELPVLVVTGYPSVSNAVQAVKSGVVDYLIKPFTQQELHKAVEMCLNKSKTLDTTPIPKRETDQTSPFAIMGMIGRSKPMIKLAEMIRLIGKSSVTVLIQGESGTGKELVARAIHYSSSRSKGPFISINCGAIPETLLESELFGVLKGAFTGAHESRIGLFEAANNGTIFLDEIGNASSTVQLRLLRVLQEKEITPVGSVKAKKVDVRIIAATNANLLTMVREGSFREDLYYRLNVISIETPPLRERLEDIPILSHYFIRKYAGDDHISGACDPDVIELFQRYSWPGNIRELENVIQRALVLGNGRITTSTLPDSLKDQPSPKNLLNLDPELLTLKEMEKKYILKVLESVDHNKSKAAEILGIDRKTLAQKIK